MYICLLFFKFTFSKLDMLSKKELICYVRFSYINLLKVISTYFLTRGSFLSKYFRAVLLRTYFKGYLQNKRTISQVSKFI